MTIHKNSVHLQDFPDVSFLSDEKELSENMDLVRAVCSTALAIRDSKNLRVRLPLNQLVVIGKNAARILPFAEIISDEVNVKSVEVKDDIAQLAELKLQVNFKKIGAKFGAKIKDITAATKSGEWKKISDKEIAIAGVTLVDDEFELKLSVKNFDEKKFAIQALPTNDCLVQLDIEVTKDLEDEGIARDIVRAIQQNRRDADLNISDHIALQIFSPNARILAVAKSFEKYICEQVLGDSLSCISNAPNAGKIFTNELDDGQLVIELKKV